jgi:hypothetical protein
MKKSVSAQPGGRKGKEVVNEQGAREEDVIYEGME